MDPNQIHLVFAPIMTAYGLAFISILWNRLEVVAATPALRHAHYFFVVVICALPLALSLPQKVKQGMEHRDKGGLPHWPPYFPHALSLQLKRLVPEKEIIFSDQPWAVAWYADRVSVWLPRKYTGFEIMDAAASDLNTPAAGILITPSSYGMNNMSEIATKYEEFTSLVIDSPALLATAPSVSALYTTDAKIAGVVKRFPYRVRVLGYLMVLYSTRPEPTPDATK
jgi:hypothetical protein